jgi:hypothetical protein
MTNRLWVVEMFGIDRWGSTVGVALNYPDAEGELRLWRERNPDDRFRLTCYTPQNA